MWTFIQCAVAIVAGYGAYEAFYPNENPKVPVVAALMFGVFAGWFVKRMCKDIARDLRKRPAPPEG
jgi:hypothetical protein